MIKDDLITLSDSPQLEYMTPKSKNIQVSKTADPITNIRQQCAQNVAPALNNNVVNKDNMFNIQLNYDINQALDPELWNSNFRAILLHKSIEYLALDIKNIKKSLNRMQKFILGKANNIKDLKEVSKVAWRFITSLYESYWDNLTVDSTNMFFRNMVKSKFST